LADLPERRSAMRTEDADYSYMPEPKPLLVLSWQDIVDNARDRGIVLTRDQVIAIFDSMGYGDQTINMDDFWTSVGISTDAVLAESR